MDPKCKTCDAVANVRGAVGRDGKWRSERTLTHMNATEGYMLYPNGFPNCPRTTLRSGYGQGQGESCTSSQRCPQGWPGDDVGDVVMREQGIILTPYNYRAASSGAKTTTRRTITNPNRPYASVGTLLWVKERFYENNLGLVWRNQMFMPKAAARLWLEVTHVYQQRLGDMVRADAEAEGCYGSKDIHPLDQYMAEWNEINGKRGYQWDDDLVVWVINFRRIFPCSQCGTRQRPNRTWFGLCPDCDFPF